MSPKRSDGKLCPGVSKTGNPCKNYFNDEDPGREGLCGHCRRRANQELKAKKKEQKRQAKGETDKTNGHQLDYDPAEMVTCAARPDCQHQMAMGHEGTSECAKTINPRRMREIISFIKKPMNELESKRFALAKALQSKLLTLKEGGGPFPVCVDCQKQLARLFGHEDIFLDYSWSLRRHRQRKEEAAKQRAEEEQKIRLVQEEAEEQRRVREKQEQERQQKLVAQADVFMAGLELDDLKADEAPTIQPTLDDLSRDWVRKLYLGELSERCPGDLDHSNPEPVFLPKVEDNDRYLCSNPFCNEQGTMLETARDSEGKEIMIRRRIGDDPESQEFEDLPLPLMFISWQPLNLVHRQGDLKGQPIISQETGKPVSKNRPVVLCHKCGKILRSVPREGEEEAYTTPLKVAVQKARARKRERDAERWNSDQNDNNGRKDQRGSRRGRGGGMRAQNQSHDFGHADPSDLEQHCGDGKNGRSRSGSIASIGDHLHAKKGTGDEYSC